MHPDTPIRVLDESIRRYGVTCVQIVPFDGGGYCVKIGSAVEPVSVGAGGLPEAIGKAFSELMKKLGRPSFDQLLEMSSLGTPRAKRLRAQTDPVAVENILKASAARSAAFIHWPGLPMGGLSGPYSSCGVIKHGEKGRFASVPEEVTCGRCRRTSAFKSATGRTAS